MSTADIIECVEQAHQEMSRRKAGIIGKIDERIAEIQDETARLTNAREALNGSSRRIVPTRAVVRIDNREITSRVTNYVTDRAASNPVAIAGGPVTARKLSRSEIARLGGLARWGRKPGDAPVRTAKSKGTNLTYRGTTPKFSPEIRAKMAAAQRRRFDREKAEKAVA